MSSPSTPEPPYLAVAIEAAKQAESVILHYFGQKVPSKTKADLSPVTIADEEAEKIIRNSIAKAFPEHTFYGEEGSKVNLDNHRGYTWIIDPIDGTKSFMRGNPLFSTLIALMKDGELILGVSNAPALQECLAAQKGYGCFLNDQPMHVSGISALEDAYFSHGGINHFEKRGLTSSLIKLAQAVRWERGIGDFWSYHLLAQGKLDIMIEADTKLWDIAALKVIVEEAGGTFTQLDGKPITGASTSALATNSVLHETVCKLFR